MSSPRLAHDSTTHDRWATTSDGTRLYVAESGNLAGPTVVLVHGLSQSHAVWKHQLHGGLAGLHVLAPDLRGHGFSDKPTGSYDDGSTWADDLSAVLSLAESEQVALVGWSYGGIILGDYLEHCGQSRVGALALICSDTVLHGRPELDDHASIESPLLLLLDGLESDDAETASASLARFTSLLTARPHTTDEWLSLFGAATLTPPRVRSSMMHRVVDHTRLFIDGDFPLWEVAGEYDQLMFERRPAVRAGASVATYPGVGHMPFWEDPDRFNRELVGVLREAHMLTV